MLNIPKRKYKRYLLSNSFEIGSLNLYPSWTVFDKLYNSSGYQDHKYSVQTTLEIYLFLPTDKVFQERDNNLFSTFVCEAIKTNMVQTASLVNANKMKYVENATINIYQ